MPARPGMTVFWTQYARKDRRQRLGSRVHADATADRILFNTVCVDTGSQNMREHAGIGPVRKRRWESVAPRAAAAGPRRQYHWPRRAISGGPQAFKYSIGHVTARPTIVPMTIAGVPGGAPIWFFKVLGG